MSGARQGWTLVRAFTIIEGFGRSRAAGQKYEIALLEAVNEARKRFPKMPVSVTEVKRVLKEFYPEKGRAGIATHELVRSGNTWSLRRIRKQ